MYNGLYNGLDNGLRSGVYNGLDSGVRNGMFENETVIKKQVVQEGLQLYLDFSNPRCYNSGRGQIGDTVSNLVNGSTKKLTIGNLTGRTTADAPYVEYNPIPYWNNYTLNGTGQNYLTSPNNTDFDIGLNGLTVSMWVNPVIALTDLDIFIGKTLWGSVTGRWQLMSRLPMQLGFLVQTSAGATIISSGNNALVIDKWQYITIVFNRITGIKLYVNNVVVRAESINTVGENLTVNRPFRVGTHSDGVGLSARFKTNYITLYNRALTLDELTYNYETTKAWMRV